MLYPIFFPRILKVFQELSFEEIYCPFKTTVPPKRRTKKKGETNS